MSKVKFSSMKLMYGMANSARKIRCFEKKRHTYTHTHTNTNPSALKLLYNRKFFWAQHKAGESEFA